MIPLLLPLLAFVAGIISSSHLDPRPVWLCLAPTLLLCFVRKRCALFVIFLAGAGLRSLELPVPALPVASEASRVEGILLRRPDWRGIGIYLDVQVSTLDGVPFRGRARLTEFIDNPELETLFRALDLGSGDRVEIVVRLRRPAVYRDPGVFDFRRYLERQGIFWTGTIRNPRLITVIQRSSSFRHAVDRIHETIEQRISQSFPDDRATQGLVLGMTLGRKQSLDAEVEREFQAGGLYHMIVVSGFNLAVIAGTSTLLARFLMRRRNARLLCVGVATMGYCLLVGNQAPVMRAAVMACTFIAARLLDRNPSPLNAIALSAMLMLAIAPADLEDSSFQMTFAAAAAVAGIGVPWCSWILRGLQDKLRAFENVELDGYLAPEIADWRVSRRMFCERHGLPHWFITWPWRIYALAIEGLIVSLAVEMVFLVFMVQSFHRLSPVSPFLNVRPE
jgi:ComEC/Rec2-related protein